ncbi:hypothetical protein SRH_03165 [Mesomycoplasma hyorhinis MCLD]|uniref:Uncharacterized protein n=1 Tax=Mesomycoplasma hyorhinis (strain MCLD) TaxID=936139 RepID=A0ABM5M6A8_MESHM|nr:hypothetical protein SRH_03165 [Mesomycoplasma hyorhinis MCLD]
MIYKIILYCFLTKKTSFFNKYLPDLSFANKKLSIDFNLSFVIFISK